MSEHSLLCPPVTILVSFTAQKQTRSQFLVNAYHFIHTLFSRYSLPISFLKNIIYDTAFQTHYLQREGRDGDKGRMCENKRRGQWEQEMSGRGYDLYRVLSDSSVPFSSSFFTFIIAQVREQVFLFPPMNDTHPTMIACLKSEGNSLLLVTVPVARPVC